jgi:hypothetical protein
MNVLLFTGWEEGGTHIAQLLARIPNAFVTVGRDYLGIASILRQQTALRMANSNAPWGDKPIDIEGSIRSLVALSIRLDADGKGHQASLVADVHSSYFGHMESVLSLIPDGAVVRVVEGNEIARTGDRALDVGSSLLRTSASDVLPAIGSLLAEPRRSQVVRLPWVQLTVKSRMGPALPPIMDTPKFGPTRLSWFRTHPDPRVRASLARWLVQKVLHPAAAEVLCALTGHSWFDDAF